jgi:hypothetical protein
MIQRILTLFLTTLLNAGLVAQSDCTNYLDQAITLYNSGKFDQVIKTINQCSVTETDPVKQWQYSRLLAESYLELNDLTMAKSAVENMLEKNPTYKPNSLEDSKQFINLLNSVMVVPRFSLSFSASAGLNISYPSIIKSFGITNDPKTYQNGKGIQFGLHSGYSFTKRWSAHLGANFTENNFSLRYSVVEQQFKYSEKLTYLQVPLFSRFQIKPKGNLKIYVDAGFHTGFLTNAKYNIERTSSTFFESSNLLNIDRSGSRSNVILGLLAGTGISYKLKEGHVFLQMNYIYSLTNLNKMDTRKNDENLIYNYFYIDDDLRINNLAFSLGYTFYLNYFVVRSKTKTN